MTWHTKQCVKCLTRRATSWYGYVSLPKKGQYALAGWCRYCVKDTGFVGHYRPAMGRRKEP